MKTIFILLSILYIVWIIFLIIDIVRWIKYLKKRKKTSQAKKDLDKTYKKLHSTLDRVINKLENKNL